MAAAEAENSGESKLNKLWQLCSGVALMAINQCQRKKCALCEAIKMALKCNHQYEEKMKISQYSNL